LGLLSRIRLVLASTAGGRMFFRLLWVFAQGEREEISERVNASVLTRARLGKSINGNARHDFQWKDRKLVVRPEEVPVRRGAYELFLQNRPKSPRENRHWGEVNCHHLLLPAFF